MAVVKQTGRPQRPTKQAAKKTPQAKSVSKQGPKQQTAAKALPGKMPKQTRASVKSMVVSGGRIGKTTTARNTFNYGKNRKKR